MQANEESDGMRLHILGYHRRQPAVHTGAAWVWMWHMPPHLADSVGAAQPVAPPTHEAQARVLQQDLSTIRQAELAVAELVLCRRGRGEGGAAWGESGVRGRRPRVHTRTCGRQGRRLVRVGQVGGWGCGMPVGPSTHEKARLQRRRR
jgi:hypothetical protein